MFGPTASPEFTTITHSVQSDILAWGTVFITVALAIYAYHRISAMLDADPEAGEEEMMSDEEQEVWAEAWVAAQPHNPWNGGTPEKDWEANEFRLALIGKLEEDGYYTSEEADEARGPQG
jgi:hypothetical protein